MSKQHTNLEIQEQFRKAYDEIIKGIAMLGYKPDNDANFDGTSLRAAKAITSLLASKGEVDSEISEMLTKTFPAKYGDMVISKHNVAFGMCPHHLLPVIYRISVAYIPKSQVLGISKLARMAKLIARAPILQEDLTHELARRLHVDLNSNGAAAYIEGLHLCMASRGVGAHESRVVTSAVRGSFLEQQATREEFLQLVTSAHPSLL